LTGETAVRCIEISGVTLYLAHPDEFSVRWIGQQETMKQLLLRGRSSTPPICR